MTPRTRREGIPVVETLTVPAAGGLGLTVKQGDQLQIIMDLAIAVTSCPASTCNGGIAPRPLKLEILRSG